MSWPKVVHSLREWRIPLILLAGGIWLKVLESSSLAQEKLPLIKKLDGPTRAKVLAALAALIILGFAMVALTWLGARVTRRYMKGTSYHRPTARPEKSDWSPQPLMPGDKLADEPDESGS